MPLRGDQAVFQNVTGRFVLNGPYPNLQPLVRVGNNTVPDPDVCADADIPDESLVVKRTNNGIANIVLFPIERPEPVRPDLVEPPRQAVHFLTDACRYSPHVLLVRTGQKVVLTSEDSVVHNTRSTFIRNSAWCFTLLPNDNSDVVIDTITHPEPLPMPVKCDIHPWMTAYWVIVDHPYAAITDENGEFTIEGLPVGTHRYRVWHERVGYIERELAITVKVGEATDLGTRQLAASLFDKSD